MQCISGSYESPVIQVHAGCRFSHLGPLECASPSYWASRAWQTCAEENPVQGTPELGSHAANWVCGLNSFQGMLFECCPPKNLLTSPKTPDSHIPSVLPAPTMEAAPIQMLADGCMFTELATSGECSSPTQWRSEAEKYCRDSHGGMTRLVNHDVNKRCGLNLYSGIWLVCCPETGATAALDDVHVTGDTITHEDDTHEGAAMQADGSVGVEVDPCTLPPDQGPCRAYMPMHYYDPLTAQCAPFTYGGCQGNDNRFQTKVECLKRCKKDSVESLPIDMPSSRINGVPNSCQITPDSGPCEALIPMYFYNESQDKCSKFFYGGCGGNDNRFTTIEACKATCSNNAIFGKAEEEVKSEIPNSKKDDVVDGNDEDVVDANAGMAVSSWEAVGEGLDPYLANNYGLEHEHKQFKQAQQRLEEVYSEKMRVVMSDYERAERDYAQQHEDENRESQHRNVLARFQGVITSLEEQYEQDRQQLHEVHRKRLQVAMDTKKAKAIQSLNTVLRDSTSNRDDVLAAFTGYMTEQQDDMNHQLRHYGHLVLTSAGRAVDARRSILEHLADVVAHVRQTNEKLLARAEIYKQIAPRIELMMSEFEAFYYKIRQEILMQRGVIPGFVTQEQKDDQEIIENEKTSFASSKMFVEPKKYLLTQPDLSERRAVVQLSKSHHVTNVFVVCAMCVGLVAVVAMLTMGLRYKLKLSRYRQNSSRGKFAPVSMSTGHGGTLDESSISMLQQNGYENPTYKFFDGK